MKSSIRIVLFLMIAMLSAQTRICAQWVKIAGNLVATYEGNFPNHEYGAIHFKNGVLWAGWSNLWSSTDSGTTWKKSNININGGVITDINFFDRLNGLFSTLDNGIFLTRDGGKTWKRILALQQCTNIAFNGSPFIIHALTVGSVPSPTGLLHTSMDGGVNWTASWPGGDFSQCFCIASDKIIYVLNSADNVGGLPGFVSSSTDFGQTWKKQVTEVDGDSWTICADSCDSKVLVVSNEDYTSTFNDRSDLFFSTNAGNSWKLAESFPRDFFTGSMTASFNAVYATSLDSGIYRSLDHGSTWKFIGGGSDSIPCAFDSRNITCASDNIVFVLDSSGSIWKTINSGGDSIVSPKLITLSRDTVFQDSTFTTCDSSTAQFITFIKNGCPNISISKLDVIGSGTSYTPVLTTGDSLGVLFKPMIPGSQNSELIITYSNGSVDTVRLRAKVTQVPYTLSFTPDTLFKIDSAFTCDSVPNKKIMIVSTGCPLPKIVSATITGTNPSDFEIVSTPGTLTGSDEVTLTFRPTNVGKRKADVIVTLDDGKTLTLPVSGYGLPSLPFSVTTVDQFSDTLGGTVQVPIQISGLQKPEDVTLVVHYDTLLKYEGTFSVSNVKLDLPNEQWIGRSKIRIPLANTTGTSAFAFFDVFNDTLQKQNVWFDSIVVLSMPPCRYGLSSPPPITSIISALTGCGITTVSNFIHYNQMPRLSLAPNPTSGDVMITASENLGDAEIIIYDMLGAEKGRPTINLQKNTPLKIILPSINGIYTIRIKTVNGVYDLRAVVNR
jgi:photosystem II stability/assembly factor-like uncharacterized protein